MGENPINEIIEQDLHNQTVLEKYLIVGCGMITNRYLVSSPLPNQPPFNLTVSRRKGLLILAFQPSMMEIWRMGAATGGRNQSVWVGETKGKRGYEIQITEVSNLDGTLFFSAVGQRNVYCANVEDTISTGAPQLNISKLKIP